MSSTINSIRGMHDTLPADMHLWHKLEDTVRSVFSAYGFEEIRVPVVEKTTVFSRAIGDATDVVEKELHEFLEPMTQNLVARIPFGQDGDLGRLEPKAKPKRHDLPVGRRQPLERLDDAIPAPTCRADARGRAEARPTWPASMAA